MSEINGTQSVAATVTKDDVLQQLQNITYNDYMNAEKERIKQENVAVQNTKQPGQNKKSANNLQNLPANTPRGIANLASGLGGIASLVSRNKIASLAGLAAAGKMTRMGAGTGVLLWGACLVINGYNNGAERKANKANLVLQNENIAGKNQQIYDDSQKLANGFNDALIDMGVDDVNRAQFANLLGAMDPMKRQALMNQMVQENFDRKLEDCLKDISQPELDALDEEMVRINEEQYKDLLINGAGYSKEMVEKLTEEYIGAKDDSSRLQKFEAMENYVENNPDICEENRKDRLNGCWQDISVKYGDNLDIASSQLLQHGDKLILDDDVYERSASQMIGTDPNALKSLINAEHIVANMQQEVPGFSPMNPFDRYNQLLVERFGLSDKRAASVINKSGINEMSYSDALNHMYGDLSNRAENMTSNQMAKIADSQLEKKAETRQNIVSQFVKEGTPAELQIAALHLDQFNKSGASTYDMKSKLTYGWDELKPSNQNRAVRNLTYEYDKLKASEVESQQSMGKESSEVSIPEINQVNPNDPNAHHTTTVARNTVKKSLAYNTEGNPKALPAEMQGHGVDDVNISKTGVNEYGLPHEPDIDVPDLTEDTTNTINILEKY